MNAIETEAFVKNNLILKEGNYSITFPVFSSTRFRIGFGEGTSADFAEPMLMSSKFIIKTVMLSIAPENRNQSLLIE